MMRDKQAWNEWDMKTITYYYSPCSASHDTHIPVVKIRLISMSPLGLSR